jgi:hypothetical protein
MPDPSLSGSDMLSNQIYGFFYSNNIFFKFIKNYINNINNNKYNNIKHAEFKFKWIWKACQTHGGWVWSACQTHEFWVWQEY